MFKNMLNDLGPDKNYNEMAKQDMDNPTSSTREGNIIITVSLINVNIN